MYYIGNLRADVDAYSCHLQIGLLRSGGVEHPRLGNRNAELVLMQTGRNIGVSFRRNIGIDAHRNRRLFLQSRRGCGEYSQFRSAFNVEEKNARAQGKLHFGGRLADAGKHNFGSGLPVCAQNPLQFSAGNDVEARAFAGYQS